MATHITSWQVVDGQLRPIDTKLADQGRTEAQDLESWIESQPALIGPDIRIIGRQIQTASGPIDLLGIDATGNLVVVELKRDRLPREALAQAIDYASDIASWDVSRLDDLCHKHNSQGLEVFLSEKFPEQNFQELILNQAQQIILIGFSIDAALERMIQWLSDVYEMSINAVLLHYVCTSTGDEVISRTSIISEEVAQQRARAKKFKIPMSDEPGSYEESELRDLLHNYLSQDMITAQRIRIVLLPLCLSHSKVQRDQLKDELVKKGVAEDAFKAGSYLSLISSQLGMAKNDFLRQVIGYEYPNNPWEKDNYFIRQDARHVAEAVLSELGQDTSEVKA